MTSRDRAAFTALTCGDGVLLTSAGAAPDLSDVGYAEEEFAATGTATSYAGHPPAAYATRTVVRRPAGGGSGTLVVEWLNVSSGQDVAPDWTYLAAEITRRGHVWAGVSAQYVGVEGGDPAVAAGVPSAGLRALDPQRYGDLHHPGDAYCYDIFTQVARGLAADLAATTVLAVGESQSAYALTTYANVVQPRERVFDGLLVHSRGGAGLPLGEPGRGIALGGVLDADPMRFGEVGVPVIVVQTETDLFRRLGFVRARQPDGDLLRVWEVAGTAHADRFQIGEFEPFLECPDPVNRGQQVYVVRAALRRLEEWVRGGAVPPSAPPLAVTAAGDALEVDDLGLALGGVRTPVVEAPADVPTGFAAPGASPICELFGRTLPLPRPLWTSHEEYLAAYERATDAAIAAGFVLPDDRAAVLAEARSW